MSRFLSTLTLDEALAINACGWSTPTEKELCDEAFKVIKASAKLSHLKYGKEQIEEEIKNL